MSTPPEEPAESPALEITKAGYANAQDVIKFIDTKASIATGLITLAIGASLLVTQWLAEREATSHFCPNVVATRSPTLWLLAQMFLVVGTGAGALALHWAIATIRPRMRTGRSRFAILFPQYDPSQHRAAAVRTLAKLNPNFTREGELREYKSQLLNVGAALFAKMSNLKRSLGYMEFQFLAYAAAFTLVMLAAIS